MGDWVRETGARLNWDQNDECQEQGEPTELNAEKKPAGCMNQTASSATAARERRREVEEEEVGKG